MWKKKVFGHRSARNGTTLKSTDENFMAIPVKGAIRKENNSNFPSKTRNISEKVKCLARRPPIATVFRVPIPVALKEPKAFIRDESIIPDLPNGVIQVDVSGDKSTPYGQDLMQYAKSMEGQLRYPIRFLEMFPRGKRTRQILVGWINEVAHYLRLEPQTLHLAVQLFDRYMMLSEVTLTNIQLVGLASLLIATKYEERWPPSVEKLVHLSDHTYSETEIREMERQVIAALKWNFHIPTAINFLDKGFDVVGRNDSTCELTHYILDLALLNHSAKPCSQSTRASAAMYLAHAILGEEKGMSNEVCIRSLNYYLDNDEVDVMHCIRTYANMLLKASDTQAATKLYWNKQVSKKKPTEILATEMLLKLEEVLESDLLSTQNDIVEKRFIISMDWMNNKAE